MTDKLLPAFVDCVATTVSALNELHSLLATEREALLGSDPARLNAVVSDKVKALSSVEQSLRKTDQLLSNAGYATGVQGGDQLLKACTHSSELAVQWQGLKDLSQQIASANSTNGQLVNQAKSGNRAALSALTGRPANANAYDKRGQGQDRLPGYELGKA